MDETCLVTEPCTRSGECLIGSLHAGHVVEVSDQAPGEVALEATELQRIAASEERSERPQHVGMHDIEVETVRVLMVRRVS